MTNRLIVSALCLFNLGVLCLNAQTNDMNAASEPASTNAVVAASTNAVVAAPNAVVAVTNTPPSTESAVPDHWPLSISGEFGTPGAGGNLSWRMFDHLGLRGGMDYLKFPITGTIEGVRYVGDIRLMSESVSLDFYPLKKLSFRISVGALFNQNQFTGSPDPNQSITLNGITFTPAQFGNVNLKIKQEPVNPYVSIGGNFFCFDRGHHWSLGGEIGVAYGQWDVSLKHTGGSSPPGLNQAIAAEQEQIEDELKKYPVWPIVKLYVSFAF